MPWEDYDKSVTLHNLGKLSFDEMLAAVSPFLREKIPEGTGKNNENLPEIDRHLGRLPNIYAWLMELWAHASNQSSFWLRSEGKTSAKYGDWVRKKDTLYELANAISLKWKGCSRMVSVALPDEVRAREFIPNSPLPPEAKKPMTKWATV